MKEKMCAECGRSQDDVEHVMRGMVRTEHVRGR